MLGADLKKHCILEPVCIQSLARDRRGGDKKNMLLCPSSFFLKREFVLKLSHIYIFFYFHFSNKVRFCPLNIYLFIYDTNKIQPK
jgi:hypothetical protein